MRAGGVLRRHVRLDRLGIRCGHHPLSGVHAEPRRWHGVWSKKSCGPSVVVLQETAQSLLAAYFAITGTHPLFSRWIKQNILLSLMVSLSMVVLHERRDRPPQRRLAEQNQPRQAFLFYRSHPSLRVGVQIPNDSQNLVSRSCRRYPQQRRHPSSSSVALRAICSIAIASG